MPPPGSSTAGPVRLPVDENQPVAPPDANGVSKFAGEQYWMLEHRVHAPPGRLAAPDQLLRPAAAHPRRAADLPRHLDPPGAEERAFEVWGGEQLRDLTYVDDVTAPSCSPPAAHSGLPGHIFNLGGSPPASLRELADSSIAAVAATRPLPR